MVFLMHGQCVVTQPKPWCSCCMVSVCCDTAQAMVFLLHGQCVVTQPKPWCFCCMALMCSDSLIKLSRLVMERRFYCLPKKPHLITTESTIIICLPNWRKKSHDEEAEVSDVITVCSFITGHDRLLCQRYNYCLFLHHSTRSTSLSTL